MRIEISNSRTMPVREFLNRNKYLPQCQVLKDIVRNGIAIEIDPSDADEMLEELERVGFLVNYDEDELS